MGTVFLARRQVDGQPVVVKFLDSDMADNPVILERFRREWEALRKIHPHPNVVRVLDVQAEGSHPLITMEFAPGTPLDALIRKAPLSSEHAARVALDMARGLSAVHAHGLIHRDVKPANAIVGPERTRLVDFGLAKDLFLSGLTQPGELLGTARYMAPEQWEEEPADARVDVFGLGATLYHMVCGRPPFRGSSMDEVAANCVEGTYPRARDVAAGLNPELELVICMALMREPAWRYPRMADMADDLERVLGGEGARVPSLVGASARYPLIPDEWITVGSAAACELVVAHPTVAPEHAQIRRKPEALLLCDFKSPQGTFVGEERVAPGRPRPLRDGDAVRFGGAAFTFHAPLAATTTETGFLRDVDRDARPAPVVDALVALGDPRSFLHCLELLTPDVPGERAVDAHLTTLLGADAAGVAAAGREHQRPEPSRVSATLNALVHAGIEGDPLQWLGWWHQVRSTAPPQVVPFAPPRPWRLRTTGGLPTPAQVSLDDETSVVLVGRDPRCQLRFDLPTAPRLHATLLRLHRRWVIVDGGSPAGTQVNGVRVPWAFVGPGDALALGAVHLALDAVPTQPAPLAPGLHAVDAASFDALARARHPATATGLVGLLSESPSGSWIGAAAEELQVAALAGHVAESVRARAGLALSLLPGVFGVDAGGDAVAWQRLLEARRPTLPPQLLPRGWLTATRSAT